MPRKPGAGYIVPDHYGGLNVVLHLDFVLGSIGSHQRCLSKGGTGLISLAEQGRLVGRREDSRQGEVI